ncbi:PH domain-containing protein [Aeromicrobium sp. CF4.19]|uniref:PH domain-containing protein n=1 Tax=Aeromicrobium sp. CF4.19 TaxID=3373082 RepID=UPI003EE4BA8C
MSTTDPTVRNGVDELPRLRPPSHRIERRAVWWWVIRASVTYGVLLVALAVTAVLWSSARAWLVAPIVIAAVLLVVQVAVAPAWRYAVHRWETTDDAVYALSGWYVREWRVAPLSRVQTIDAVRGPLEQAMGLATLKVTTASSSGAVAIVGLDHRLAAELAEQLTAITEQIPGDAT